jgi:hypothetical protein
MVALRAAQLSKQFHEKSRDAQCHSPQRFMGSHGLVFCLGINEAQCLPGEVATDALDFMENVVCSTVPQGGGRHNNNF